MEIYKNQSGAAMFIDFEVASKTGSVSCRVALWDSLGDGFFHGIIYRFSQSSL